MTTARLPHALLDAAAVDWDTLSSDQIHDTIRDAFHALADREEGAPSDGVLQRSMQLEDTMRAATGLQYQYTGLLKDAFDEPKLRHTLDLPEGKTAFRDATDLLAKTHGIRAHEASARMRLAAAMTPARASDPDRQAEIGKTRLPILGAFQGRVNPSKLSSALSMIEEVDTNAQTAGKDEAYRAKLQRVIEHDLAEKIEHTTPEEFSRYVSQRKKDLLASIDPPDKDFSQRQSDAMYDVRRVGPVRGNKNAVEYRMITDAEGDELLQTLLTAATNPRGKDDDDAEFETRSRGHRRMHAFRDALKFVLANFDKTGFRGASGSHTQMVVMTDYATLLEGLRRELGDQLPELGKQQREALMQSLALNYRSETPDDAAFLPELPGAPPDRQSGTGVITHPPDGGHPHSEVFNLGDRLLAAPPPKTTSVDDILDDKNLDRLQQRISHGVYSNYIPPDVIMRLRCDVGITPITLTGQRQVLSVGRQQRQFRDSVRRAIIARDRGCAVPGCHMAASMCEIHHFDYWSRDGETSTDNGVLLCSHHHQAVHVDALKIMKVNGEFQFVLHPLIDSTQQPRKNYFYQT